MIIDKVKFYNTRKLQQAKLAAKSDDIADIRAEYEKLGGLCTDVADLAKSPVENKIKAAVKRVRKKTAKKTK